MCGRTRCTLRPDDVPRASHRHTVPTRFLHLDRYRPSYNVAPGSYIPVLRRDNEEVVGDGVVVHCMKWGLVPSFTKKTDKPDFFKMFNARSESVAEKASFRRLLPKNRCLVAVDGFYEWKKEGSKKQPYYIHFEDGRPLVFAALFDTWQNSGGETLYTFTILTTASSSALQWLHDRMPVILGDKDSIDTWLDDPSTTKLQPLLSPYEKSDLVWYPVTSAIGKPTFDGPECIQQIPLKTSQNSLISKFFSTKQPKTDEGDKETKSTDANIIVDLKKEPTAEKDTFSDSIKKIEELDGEKDMSNVAKNLEFQEIVKAEPFVEDNSAVASLPEPVKNDVQEGTKEEGKSLKTGLTKETDERLNQLHEAVEDIPGNENQKTVLTSPTTKEGGLVFSEKSGTKRDYEVFSAQEKPQKHYERLQNVKSSGKQGKMHGMGKSNIKKSKETQSTLHFFFDEK
ncbi:embryonic stem cell-specific 5-hydroxymethylcytosine-binding protein [Arabidopsis thaliana]|uniref:Embryonic stem cell-specific 5-hydroxymethylcytosine-binding protein n=1 Tax=Arabidopsis thaliana TaxID=3702 RepID=A0A1P8B2X4_ARATH|nr:embryonic stem cell-specific 5-hydroxymethylcytosine-binding protein [Arabidopsis thaliana]ANM63238.1 embryonic stem cell-specific 5-hydroxymethylcytosine-binding protein [Arabidopsis thaliana]|eukprot:NP_001325340.1 embryonic stem cell-specific 5-hydroxymethylcytosine-binding protein [Arabidopsis thaliana]